MRKVRGRGPSTLPCSSVEEGEHNEAGGSSCKVKEQRDPGTRQGSRKRGAKLRGGEHGRGKWLTKALKPKARSRGLYGAGEAEEKRRGGR